MTLRKSKRILAILIAVQEKWNRQSISSSKNAILPIRIGLKTFPKELKKAVQVYMDNILGGGGRVGGTPYHGLYGEAPPRREPV